MPCQYRIYVAAGRLFSAQTAEAEASVAGWVKIRAKLINTGIDLVWSVTKKVVTKILEKAADNEIAPATQ